MVDMHSYRKTSEISNHQYPSFSSSLLDSIYRSIDHEQDEMVIYREPIITKKKIKNPQDDNDLANMANFQRACMIEKWMEKKVTEKVILPKKDRKTSNSSSSDSSFFSSSELADSSFPIPRPKPVHLSQNEELGKNQLEIKTKTKSRVSKIYGDLKKVKQPISPGGKVAAFLNSLFSTKHLRNDDSPSLKSTNTSTCSSASSFSRSCLSKTPTSSRGKCSAGGEKRSVRFFTDDEQNNNKNSHSNTIKTGINEELIMMHIMEKNRRVEEAARDSLRNYRKTNRVQFEFELPFDQMRKTCVEKQEFEDEDEDDGASYASSDLFELDNLSAIGMDQRYTEELPVYETTHVRTNKAIANGLIL